MTAKRFAIAFLCALMAVSAWAEEGGSEKAVPVGPPQPRVVEPLGPSPLPPRAADPSWLLYNKGVELYGKKRLGESLVALKEAVESRAALSERAVVDIQAALDAKEAAKARGSLTALMRLLEERYLISSERERLRDRAGGSLVAELGLIRETAPPSPLRGLVDAALLVVEERGLSRVGDSLAALMREATGLGSYPEAEYWIGKVYLAEGEARLAELQFARACGMSSSLELEGQRFEMLDALARVYRAEGKTKDYEDSLRSIADASDLFSKRDEYYRNAMERTIANQGFDKFMSMYRVDQVFAIGAYSELGALYLEGGRPIATIYLAAAANAALTRAMLDIRADEPGYAYAGLADLLSRILSDPARARYASDAALWKNLVLLGRALSSTGDRESAREIWAIVSRVKAPEPWGRRADALLAQASSGGHG